MKKLLSSTVSAVSVGLILFGASTSGALRVCLSGEERIGLTPSGAVTFDGLILQRSTATGRYQTDAGLEFDVNGTELVAIDPLAAACTNNATTLRITVKDPFTGFSGVVEAVTP